MGGPLVPAEFLSRFVSNQWSVAVSATLVSLLSREASIQKAGSSASRSASLVSS
jgi:hypothetical protein